MDYATICAQNEKAVTLLPKAELHVHIEGTLTPELLFQLADKNNVTIPYKTVDDVRKAYQFDSLQSFLDLYYQGMSVLLHEEDFEALAYAYTEKMNENNVLYAEVFFDPQGHTCRGVAVKTVYNGLISGFRKGEQTFGITCALIFSFLRHTSEEECLSLLQSQDEQGEYIRGLFKQNAFIAIGLDSSEVNNPPQKFKKLYRYCRDELGVTHAVAHAGEEGPPEYVWSAIKDLKVDRIDHGVKCMGDENLVKHLKETQLPLTVCPLSNIQLKVYSGRMTCASAVVDMYRAGLFVTVNSDDPSYFGGYVNDNFRLLAETGRLFADDLACLAANSFRASFLPEEKKNLFVAKVDEVYQSIVAETGDVLPSGEPSA